MALTKAVSDLSRLLATLAPQLHDGVYACCQLGAGMENLARHAVVTVSEAEGVTAIFPETLALQAGVKVLFRAAWVTLTVHSDLHAVGLTAAVAAALADAGISCNVVAGACHDHLFVPAEQASRATEALRRLQDSAKLIASEQTRRRTSSGVHPSFDLQRGVSARAVAGRW